MWKAETGEAYVFVVEISHMSVRDIRPVDPDVYKHAGRTGQALRGIHHVTRNARDHGKQVRQWDGGNKPVIAGHQSIRKGEFALLRINGNDLVVQLQVP